MLAVLTTARLHHRLSSSHHILTVWPLQVSHRKAKVDDVLLIQPFCFIGIQSNRRDSSYSQSRSSDGTTTNSKSRGSSNRPPPLQLPYEPPSTGSLTRRTENQGNVPPAYYSHAASESRSANPTASESYRGKQPPLRSRTPTNSEYSKSDSSQGTAGKRLYTLWSHWFSVNMLIRFQRQNWIGGWRWRRSGCISNCKHIS